MNNRLKMVLTILLILACLVYTFINYAQGKTEITMGVVACAVLGLPLVNIIRSLIEDLRG